MLRTLLYFLTAALFYGCASVSVQHMGEVPSNVDGQKGTYAWIDNAPSEKISRVNNPELDKIVRASVEKQLLQRGFKAVSPDQADYLISWFGKKVEEVKEMSVTSMYAAYGYSTLVGSMPKNVDGGKVQKVFPRGTLVIDVLDVDTKKVIWRGSATNTFNEGMSDAQARQYINTSVKKILDDLPRQN